MLQFNKYHQLVDGIFLLKLTTPTSPSLIAMSKYISDLSEDIKSFEFCTPSSEPMTKNHCTFVFSNGEIFYYTLYFQYQQEGYEIVIKSYQRCAHFFFDFLKQLYTIFADVKSAYDPNNFFNLAKILITDWPTTLENEMKIVFPYKMTQVEFTNADFTFHHYNPTKYIPSKLCLQVLSYLFTMKPILIVAPDAATGSRACFSVFSLIHPLRYFEPFIFWLRKEDPRYNEIMKSEKKSPYYVVVTDDATELQSKFDLILPITETYKPNLQFESDFEDFVRKILLLIQSELVNLNNKNPYSDILEIPWTDKNMEDIVNDPKYSFMPKMNVLKVMEKSKTIKNWRLRRCSSELIRSSLLQCGEMNFDDLSKDQLEIIIKYLQSIKNEFQGDLHINAVIKKHMTIVNNLLKQYNSNQ